jgi:hypothetical protein
MDSLGRSIDLNHRLTLFPLGFPLELRSNDARVLEAASTSWGCFAQRFNEKPLDIRVVVSADGGVGLPPQPTFRAQGHLTAIAADRSNFATFDYSKGVGAAWIQESVAADSSYLRWFFLEAMVYCLLTEMHLTPIHAACIAMYGRGVLLVGDSGAGKSTLAFGCARRGWDYVSDDAVWMMRRRDDLHVLGLPHRARLRPDCARLFPELAGYSTGVGANGKPTVDVSLRDCPAISSDVECRVAACVFLRRSEGQSTRLDPVDAADASRRLAAGMVVYDEGPREEQLLSLKRMAAAPAYELHYGDIDSASEILKQLLSVG